MTATRHIWIGGGTLALLAVAGWIGASQRIASTPGLGLVDVSAGIARWVSGSRVEIAAVSDADLVLAPGDPIVMQDSDGRWRQVGLVRNHFGADRAPVWTKRVTVVLDERVLADRSRTVRLEHHTSPTSLNSVVEALLPQERRHEIARLIANDWTLHREEIVGRLQPLLEGTLQIAVKEIETALPAALQKHRADFGKLADRYQSEIIRGRIVPLVGSEILPIVEEEFRPLANELGRDLWDRVSVWAFTWRFLYDVSPLPERNAVQKEFDRFLAEEVLPAMEARSDEFIAVTERVLKRISRNDQVRAVVRENLRTVASDPELHSIVWKVIQESMLANESMRTSLREYWTGADVSEALQLTSSRFEPTARRIGDLIFGNREAGVSPEFARVLRAQILLKDHRWLVLVSDGPDGAGTGSGELRMMPATVSMEFPLQFQGERQSPLTEYRDPEP